MRQYRQPIRGFPHLPIFIGLLAWFFSVLPAPAIIDATLQMQLGNPSGATANTNNHDHYLIQRAVEAIDYSDNLGEPNWVSWDLTAADIGSSGRSSSFFTDTNLPPNFYWVKTSDYTHSGYDRGHMCPSADRTDNTNDNKLVFYMSNIVPQTPDNNQGVWENLESYCQSLAQSGYELLITCGPNGFSDARINTNGPVYIPDYTWKIVLVVPLGPGNALERITTSTRVIAVNVPNISGIRSDPWTNYLTTINQLQTNTGFVFLTALPASVAAVLRAKVDGTPAPMIASFSPTNGSVGDSITITGSNLMSASTVMFNGTNASFTINSESQITALVPAGATTGPIAVIAAGGLATGPADFTVTTLAPILKIAFTPTNTVVLSWPSPSAGFVLRQSPDLTATNWMGVTNNVQTVGDENQTIVPSPAGSRFFRLVQP